MAVTASGTPGRSMRETRPDAALCATALAVLSPSGTSKGGATHQQRPQRRAQRPHVLRRMDTRRTRDLLGRCPHDRKTIAAAARICPHMLRYTEIRQDRRAVGIHHDVAGLDITVHETHTMQHLRAATHAMIIDSARSVDIGF